MSPAGHPCVLACQVFGKGGRLVRAKGIDSSEVIVGLASQKDRGAAYFVISEVRLMLLVVDESNRRPLWSTHVDMMDERKMPEAHPRGYVLNGVEQYRGGRGSAGSRAKRLHIGESNHI